MGGETFFNPFERGKIETRHLVTINITWLTDDVFQKKILVTYQNVFEVWRSKNKRQRGLTRHTREYGFGQGLILSLIFIYFAYFY